MLEVLNSATDPVMPLTIIQHLVFPYKGIIVAEVSFMHKILKAKK